MGNFPLGAESTFFFITKLDVVLEFLGVSLTEFSTENKGATRRAPFGNPSGRPPMMPLPLGPFLCCIAGNLGLKMVSGLGGTYLTF